MVVGAIAARGSPVDGQHRVVDEDHLALGGQRIGQGGIPVVEVAAEVLKHQQRRRGRVPEAPVCEIDARRLDEPSLGGGVGDRCDSHPSASMRAISANAPAVAVPKTR
jgi:hypothetical protein